MVIPKPLLIAGGLGLAGGAAWLLFKGKGEKPAEGEAVDPAAAGAGAGGLTPTAGTDPSGGLTPTGTTTPGAGLGGAGTGAGSGGLQGQQVGPYTVVPDQQSGQMIVFETATQQPVGILDAQGNLVPLDGGAGAGQGTMVPEGAGLTPQTGTTTAGVPQARAGQQAQYESIAKDLFANAGNPAVGAASSDAMAGQANIAPAAGLQAGATSSTGVGAGTAGTGTPTGVSTTSGGVTSKQVGNYTLLDDGSGVQVVLDTATQQPVAMMDAAGNVTPISVDAAGNVSVAGGTGGAASGAASLGTGTGAGSSAGLTGASTGAAGLTGGATVTSPTSITSPVGAIQ